jgi:DNA-binding protein Fis
MGNAGEAQERESDGKGNGSDYLRAGVSLEDMERRLVEMTLEATGGNRSRAADLLGVSLRTVRNKVRSYGLPSWSSYVHD